MEEEDESGLEDRSSQPLTNPNVFPPETVQEIITIRKERKITCNEIVRELNMQQRTVSC